MFWTQTKKSPVSSQTTATKSPLAISLEPRMMFDGAVAATAADATVTANTDAAGAHDSDATAEHLAAAPSSTTPEERHEVVFIDASVKDKQQLLDSLVAGTEVVVLDANSDGLKQMADYLNGRSGIDAIHFISHGGEASLQVGSTRLGLDNMASAQSQLSAIGSSLAENGDFLIYGCDTSKGEQGAIFVEQLANFTGADIAASNDWTGDASKGGDWVLETNTGAIEATSLFADAGYSHVLNTLNAGDMVVLGWNALNDTITFATLVDIPAGTVLKITDWGWDASGSAFTGTTTGDGLITWTTSSTISAGTVLNLYLGGSDDVTTLTNVTANTDLTGDIDIIGYSATDPMNIAGDSVFIYQDSDATPYFIFGMNNSSGTNIDADNWNTSTSFTPLRDSTLPGGAGSQNALTNGTNAIGLPGGASQQDNVQYTGPTSAADRATWLARITNLSNWSGSANSGDSTSVGVSPGSVINITANSAPTIGNLNGDSVAWPNVGNTVTLDLGSNASLADAELGALNGGNGNWSGASLVIQRNGTAVSSDVLGFDTSGALFTVSNGNLQANGQTFATFTNTGGVLTISFTSSGTTATTALVNDVAQRITYRNDTPAGDANVKVTLNDGSGGSATANVTVATDFIYVTNASDTATIDASNGTSFSEAVAIAANDNTGSQTIVFASNLAGQSLTLNSVSINESLTFDMDQASGLVLTGGTITLAGDTTQTFAHGSGDSATISSVIAGSGALNKAGAGNLTLSGTGNTFSGGTSISAGTLTASGSSALADNGSLSVSSGATLALSSNETIGNLSGAGSINLGSSSLTSNQTADTTFSGNISGTGGLNLNQIGSATYSTTLSGTNTYTGNTVLGNYGWLKLNGDASMSSSNSVRVNGNSVLTLLSDQTIGSLASNNINASIQLGSYTLSAGGDNTSTSVSGTVSGTGSLIKQGSGTLTLAGSNTYGGTTTVSAGTLSVASDGNLGSGTINLAGGSVLDVSGSTTIDNAIVLTGNSSIGNSSAVAISGAISGAYDLSKTGAGTLTLSGNNSYGATFLNAGTLSIANDGNLGSGAVNLAAGTTLALTGASIIDNAIVLGGDATVTASANATLSGVVSGAYALTKAGAANLTLDGSNTYGATTVSAGTLSVASDSNLGSGTLTLAAGSTLAVTSATTIDNAIALSGAATVSTSADTTLSGVISGSNDLTKTGAAALTLSGSNTYSGSTSVSTGTLSVASDANLGAGSLNLANGTTLQITGNTTIDNALVLTGIATVNAGAASTLSGTLSGTGSLTKTGSSSLTLAGSNTNTGNTTVSAGTLVVDGSTSSATTVASGATLTGSGTLGGDVTVQNGATLSPGSAGAGNLTISGNLTLNAGSTLVLDINGATAGTGYDRIVVNGAVDVSGATLSVNHGYAAGIGETYAVIVNDMSDAITGTFSGTNEGSKFNALGNGTELTASYIGGTGNDFTLTAPIAPIVTSVSSSSNDVTYKIGDTITITVQFDSVVNVTGTPTLTLETGSTDRVLDYVSGSGSDTLSFSYTVQAGDISADLDYISTSALSLNGGTIKDASNQSALLALPTPGAAGSLGANKALVVDGVRPAASSISLSDSTLGIGETATVTITFNEAVLGLDIGDFNVANGTLSSPISSNGGQTWTATFTPSANITNASNIITLNNTGVMDTAGNIGSGSTDSANYAVDTQRPSATIVVSDTSLKGGQTSTVTITFTEAVTGLGIADFNVANGALSNLSTSDNITYTATLTPGANVTNTTNLVTLDNTGVQDLAGNAGTGTTDSNNYAIDTQLPTASIVVADSALKAGQTTTVTITFSEAVTGLGIADFSVANGALSNLSTSDNFTYTATLTPNANVTDTTNLIALDNTGYTDLAGNTGLGSTDSNNYAIDSRAPTVISVDVPPSGTYLAGNNLDFTVNFDEAVTVDTTSGTPRLAITLDTGGVVYANYLSGSGSTALVFRLSVANGQQDNNGIALGASLDAHGATLRDAAGNNAQSGLNNVASTVDVLVDAAAPQITNIALDGTSPTRDTTLSFTVTFSEDVSGVDLTDFALATSGSASGTLLSLVQVDARTYRVTVSGVTGQGTLGLSLAAAGSGITDTIGNAMANNFATVGYVLGGVEGDPEFRANPTPGIPNTPTTPIQPSVPGAPPSSTTSPLLPPPLFEQPTLGSGVPTVGNIFINQNALAPSYIAQVFSSSESGLSDGGASGFLGFGGGDGGVFGTSSFSSMFSKDVPQQDMQLKVFDGRQWRGGDTGKNGGGLTGAPTLGQQLHAMKEADMRPVRELAQALGQVAGATNRG